MTLERERQILDLMLYLSAFITFVIALGLMYQSATRPKQAMIKKTPGCFVSQIVSTNKGEEYHCFATNPVEVQK